jgi:hypothetical protein
MERIRITGEEFFPEGHVALRVHLDIAPQPDDAMSGDILDSLDLEGLDLVGMESAEPDDGQAPGSSNHHHSHG